MVQIPLTTPTNTWLCAKLKMLNAAMCEETSHRMQLTSVKKHEEYVKKFIYDLKLRITVTEPFVCKLTFFRKFFVKYSNTQFHGNPQTV
jgi:hypothetical protein